MKTIAFLIFVLTFGSQSVVGCPISDDCRPLKVDLDYDVLSGQVVTITGGKSRPGTNALIDLLEFRDGAWQSTGKIGAIDHGFFTWRDIPPGNYVLVVSLDGYPTAKVNVHVRKRHGRERRIIIHLKANGCADATSRPSRSMKFLRGTPNKSLDASGGSASRDLLGAAKGALIRAAASTQSLCCCHSGNAKGYNLA